MCGIFGWAVAPGRAGGPTLLAGLTDLLRHRGPDDGGYWSGATRNERWQIGLGHRRLSILDIGGGGQPMWSADGSVVVVFNGEIYNFVELRDELRARGHAFRTSSDTEVLIEAYRAFGIEALGRFRGMFAFALWDENAQSLLLARDHFGKKPLFLAETPGALVFGSEIEPILRFPGLDRGWDEGALGEYLLNRYVPGPGTFFRAVRKLPPGCYATWKDGRLAVARYFTPPLADTAPDLTDFDDAVARFTATFDEAVRLRMRSDAPFGAFLSGGLDSSAVVATMARHATAPLRTLSVGFPEERYSELSHARLVAGHLGTDHHEIVVTPEALAQAWPEAIRRRGAPVSEPSDLPILLLSKAARSSVKMVLTGEGADEMLGGYPKHAAEGWVALYQALVPGLLHERAVRPAMDRLPLGARRLKTLAKSAGERDFATRMRLWFGGVSTGEREALLGQPLGRRPPDAFPFSSAPGSALRRTLFFDQTSWLPDNLLERGDRMMMAGSIEGRMPFMDVELARLAARMPDRFLIRRGRGKAVLRAAMPGRIPASILTRKKVGFRVPVDAWFRGAHRDTLLDLLRSRGSETRRLCVPAALDALIDAHLDGRQNHEKILWSLANLEMFMRAFAPGGDASEPADHRADGSADARAGAARQPA
jgi:asparagine synthase (glutamine-hydrolysing)